MPTKKKILEPDGLFFMTFTCYDWISLIEMANAHDLVYKWFDYLKSCGHYINGYVIMPNHLHSLIAFRNTGKSINTIIGNGKRILAYQLISRLQEQNEENILNELREAVTKNDRKRHKIHEVWEDSFDWKECKSHEYIKQKLDYMHENPCRGKWNLAASPVDYEHSSARFYISGQHAGYPVTHYLELEDIDLTSPLIV